MLGRPAGGAPARMRTDGPPIGLHTSVHPPPATSTSLSARELVTSASPAPALVSDHAFAKTALSSVEQQAEAAAAQVEAARKETQAAKEEAEAARAEGARLSERLEAAESAARRATAITTGITIHCYYPVASFPFFSISL